MRAQAVTVALNGVIAGRLYRDGSGTMSFEHTLEWLSSSAKPLILARPHILTRYLCDQPHCNSSHSASRIKFQHPTPIPRQIPPKK